MQLDGNDEINALLKLTHIKYKAGWKTENDFYGMSYYKLQHIVKCLWACEGNSLQLKAKLPRLYSPTTL